ncbi:DUF4913 domain-containing protein [Kocuria sabuli]|uniref:DUF4913 domain-containing protein n=1 Tax=Kocuria sabuli TaxID=3071448 RepID=UPI0034D47F4F
MSEPLEEEQPIEQEQVMDHPTREEFAGWVEGLLAQVESVDLSANMHWCSQWWAHPEAVERLSALHAQWILARQENTMSSWWVNHFDAHATVLFSVRGPFAECGTSHVEKGYRRTLVCEPPSAEWFTA